MEIRCKKSKEYGWCIAYKTSLYHDWQMTYSLEIEEVLFAVANILLGKELHDKRGNTIVLATVLVNVFPELLNDNKK